ncbi:MAG: PilT/PilU family type 4a pilus ATPase [Planctomycetota bacterium]|nr:PilT/PilU family type 4a pilus ATPase [Planctomycetota bacterium]
MASTDSKPIDRHDHGSLRNGRKPRLHEYFRAMVKQGASDLHFKADTTARLRLGTKIVPVRGEPLTREEIADMADEILDDRQRAFFAEIGSIDVAEELKGSDRFRINIYRQRGKVSIAVRRVSRQILSFEELNLPPQIRKISEHASGIVLVAGITGSGKSTTIAAMLEHINQTRPCHIVTIEDPIEYLYSDAKALINQREVGIDIPDFSSALKYLMREDPDVVLIGEMRDRETFGAALQAAETGHLVFGSIHSSGAAQTIGRILDLFDPESRDLVRQSLGFNLRAIICQRLLPCLAKGIDRVPAVEILLNNPSARQIIEEKRDAELFEVIRSGEYEGMQDFTASLLELVEKDYVDPKVAYEVAPNPDELKMRMKGISASRTGLRGR